MSFLVYEGNLSEVASLVWERNNGVEALYRRSFEEYPLGGLYLSTPDSDGRRVRTWAEANMPIIPEAEWDERFAAMQDRFVRQRNAAAGTKPSNQGRLGYCWTASGTQSLQSGIVLAGDKFVELAWESAGGAVGWQNRGNSLVSWLNWATKHGICRREFVSPEGNIDPKTYKSGWQDDALNYRLDPDEIFDLGAANMRREVVSAALSGYALYAAYNRFRHAMSIEALEKKAGKLWTWSPNTWGPLQDWLLDVYPDEAYAIRVVQSPLP